MHADDGSFQPVCSNFVLLTINFVVADLELSFQDGNNKGHKPTITFNNK